MFRLRTRKERRSNAYNGAYGVLLSGGCLFEGIVDYKVQEEVIASQDAADFATTLEMNEQLLVHKLRSIVSGWIPLEYANYLY